MILGKIIESRHISSITNSKYSTFEIKILISNIIVPKNVLDVIFQYIYEKVQAFSFRLFINLNQPQFTTTIDLSDNNIHISIILDQHSSIFFNQNRNNCTNKNSSTNKNILTNNNS